MFSSKIGAHRRKGPKATVMLTSMMDMFTIILVFLLYNFSAEEQNFDLKNDLTLPTSSAQEKLETAVNVVISRSQITVENVVVAGIRQGELVRTVVKDNRIVPLIDELKRRKARSVVEAYKSGETLKEEQSVVLVQADQHTSFKILDMVLKSSGLAGYPKFRFAVFRREA